MGEEETNQQILNYQENPKDNPKTSSSLKKDELATFESNRDSKARLVALLKSKRKSQEIALLAPNSEAQATKPPIRSENGANSEDSNAVLVQLPNHDLLKALFSESFRELSVSVNQAESKETKEVLISSFAEIDMIIQAFFLGIHRKFESATYDFKKQQDPLQNRVSEPQRGALKDVHVNPISRFEIHKKMLSFALEARISSRSRRIT